MAELLLVDNDARITELVAWFLEARGHRVRIANSFHEARLRIEERTPDLLLSDVELGRENARTELPALARAGRLPPTLVVSGYLDAAVVRELSSVPGVVGTLAKPYELAVLERRIAEALALAQPAPSGDLAEEEEEWVELQPGPELGAREDASDEDEDPRPARGRGSP
jgi:DNA-binding response OmpR family regulator